MSGQLDILALEPFYGGVRRSMLETIIRCSRHRWTLFKLPPRRIERRLSAAAHWFAEQLSRHWVGRVDVLFTSEALNLADLVRLLPSLANKPSVVYFHSNELPDPGQFESTGPHELVNLSTAQAATELWFNSDYHIQNFAYRTAGRIQRHPELSSRNPLPEMLGKSYLMFPPVELNVVEELAATNQIARKKRTIFVETRDADMDLLNAGLATLAERGEKFDLITVGPVEELSTDFTRITIPEADEVGQIKGMLTAGLFLSVRRWAPVDLYFVRAMAAKCWPVVPPSGVYPEIIPKEMHECCLHDQTSDNLATRIQDAWHLYNIDDAAPKFVAAVKVFDAISACRAMDDRLSRLAITSSIPKD
jgi:hypothetical protein